MTVLDRIIKGKYAEVAERRAATSDADLATRIARQSLPRGFRAALDAAPGHALIAEIKRASPSKGLIRADFDPPAHARAYQAGGAACLSVLTDERWFQGSAAYLEAARAAVTIPVLRKDFTVDPWQVGEARAMGADAILLIVAALSDAQLAECEAAAIDHGMDVLVEVHDEAELARALRLHSRLIGVNNRDLHDFSVDVTLAPRLARLAPADCTFVAESGLTSRADLDALAAQGIGCFLIGEALMRQPDIEAATRVMTQTPSPPGRGAPGEQPPGLFRSCRGHDRPGAGPAAAGSGKGEGDKPPSPSPFRRSAPPSLSHGERE